MEYINESPPTLWDVADTTDPNYRKKLAKAARKMAPLGLVYITRDALSYMTYMTSNLLNDYEEFNSFILEWRNIMNIYISLGVDSNIFLHSNEIFNHFDMDKLDLEEAPESFNIHNPKYNIQMQWYTNMVNTYNTYFLPMAVELLSYNSTQTNHKRSGSPGGSPRRGRRSGSPSGSPRRGTALPLPKMGFGKTKKKSK